MIDFLRRLLGRPGSNSGKTLAAPLSNSLLLVVGRGEPAGAGALRASGSFARRRISICELTGDEDNVPSTTGLAELVDDLLPRLDQSKRSELFDFILSAVLPDLDKPGAYALGKSLHVLRERLRKPLPPLTFQSGEPAVVDSLVMVDERSFWVVGWCIDPDMLRRVELISPEGQRVGSLESAYRYPRPDVEKDWAGATMKTTNHGFTKYFELPAPSLLGEGWFGELQTFSGTSFQVEVPPVVRDPGAARGSILFEASVERPDIEELRRDHAYPALTRLQAHIKRSIAVESVVQHGEPPPSPEVSIVVPLYERIDLLEHQISQFWRDPDIAAAELIYVLDGPELGPDLARLAAELNALYGLPFKVLRLNRNAGYAAANNLAASQARGRLLVLLNSDVLPAGPGWLSTMSSFYDATPEIGALGPKLLYEDDSIQHAGMYFQLDPTTRFWENQHYYKGFSRSLPAANVNRPVAAVTGACLMIQRALYEELDGLREDYIQGGFEDSDLCLRLIEAGRDNWYLASVELYHLEAQSFPIQLRVTNPYNSWLQTHLWNERIQEVMQRQHEIADVHVVPVG